MNTKGMIRSSWQKFRNSCGTSHHPRCNVPLAHGGCVPLGFCAEDHGRKLRIMLNPRCNGSASTSTSSVRYGSFTRYSLRPQLPRSFGRDNILDGTSLSNCSFRKSMARTSWTQSIPSLHVFYGVSKLGCVVCMHITVNKTIIVSLTILRPADPNANITFRFVNHNGTVLGLSGYAYVPGLATGTEVTLVALGPNEPTVVMA